MNYRTLLLDALPRLDLELDIHRTDTFRVPTPGCTPFDITSTVPLIDDFFHKHTTKKGRFYSLAIGSELPPIAVPYEETWWEWIAADRDPVSMGGLQGIAPADLVSFMAPHQVGAVNKSPVVFGCHVRAFTREVLLAEHEVAIKKYGWQPSDDRFRKFYEAGRWTLEMILYASQTNLLKPGGPCLVPLRGLTVLDEKGLVINQLWERWETDADTTNLRNEGGGFRVPGRRRGVLTNDPNEFPEHRRTLTGLFAGVLFAMGLLGCRNVHQEPVDPPPALSKKRVRRGGLPLVRYHRLRVRVPGQKAYYDPELHRARTPANTPVGLHYVRGHFKTFSPERPLFGHATGTFYWPPLLRGKASAGVVGKTYIETPGESFAVAAAAEWKGEPADGN